MFHAFRGASSAFLGGSHSDPESAGHLVQGWCWPEKIDPEFVGRFVQAAPSRGLNAIQNLWDVSCNGTRLAARVSRTFQKVPRFACNGAIMLAKLTSS